MSFPTVVIDPWPGRWSGGLPQTEERFRGSTNVIVDSCGRSRAREMKRDLPSILERYVSSLYFIGRQSCSAQSRKKRDAREYSHNMVVAHGGQHMFRLLLLPPYVFDKVLNETSTKQFFLFSSQIGGGWRIYFMMALNWYMKSLKVKIRNSY